MSHAFTGIEAVAAPLRLANVDTDKILPGRFLKTTTRRGLGAALFYTLRFDERGLPRPDFVLNRAPWSRAGILIALDNFGCGSSREHAPWALLDFGIRAIIAPSFADIFYNNCFRNGILPIVLDAPRVEALMADAEAPGGCILEIDLAGQTITRTQSRPISFAIAPERKHALLLGLDEVSESERHLDAIQQWEAGRLYPAPAIPADALWD